MMRLRFWLLMMDVADRLRWERPWWLALRRAAAATDWGEDD